MNKLPIAKRTQIINLLVEGMSMRAVTRIADVSINTVSKLLIEVGKACQDFHNATVVGLKSNFIQADEIWSFVYSKQKNIPDGHLEDAGDVWTWTGLDADSKMIISWYVGDRNADCAYEFLTDLKSRITNRVQLTTDGHKAYLQAVDEVFDGQIDYSQLIKIYGGTEGSTITERKYSPNECTGTEKRTFTGAPIEKFVSTSYVERQNLTMRMHNRRFTRLTNAFSKKIDNHCHAIALHFVYYNFAKIHKTLSVTPAMQAGLTKKPMTIQDIVMLADIQESTSKKRGPYKKKED